MSRRRARFVGAVVHLHLVADDGTTLAPIPADPITVPATSWPPNIGALVDELDRRLAAEDNGAGPAEAADTEAPDPDAAMT